MICPACGATNVSGDETCSRCKQVLPVETHFAAGFNLSAGSEADSATRVVLNPKAESEIATQTGDSSPSTLESAIQERPANETSNWLQHPAGSASGGKLIPGGVLGSRYEILKALGEGGMGAVYQARDLEVDRIVAIKIIRPELADNPSILRRFKQELVLARQITHRNVVRIYDLGVADGLRFISMEYIEGRELAGILAERGKLPAMEAAGIMLQVYEGLDAAHRAGVVHRDLKPQNIMIAQDERAAVMDFGIALSSETGDVQTAQDAANGSDSGLTQIGSLLGTPRYMSPEQARCEKVDARSDLFTAGLIFYELLTGTLPFTSATPKETLLKRTKELAQPPAEIDTTIPKPLSDIAAKCLQIDPDLRYQSAREVIEALETELGLTPAVHHGPWRWVASAMAVVTLAAAGLFVKERFFSKPLGPHPLLKLLISDFRNQTGDPVFTGTLEPMFNVALEGASFIHSYNRGQARKLASQLRPGATTLDENLARLVAVREGLGAVIGGSITKKGSGYDLSAEAVDAVTGKTIAARSTRVRQKSDISPAVAQLAAKIRSAMGDTTPQSAQIAAAETFTSGSLEAGQKYAQAQELQWAGKWGEAIDAYAQAIRIDPNLGRAYAGMAATLANQGRRAEAEKQYQMALARLDRMSDREKYRTRGGYYLLRLDYQKAIDQFRAVEKQYPFDSSAIANLALANFYGRNMAAALEEGRRAVAIFPNNILQRNNVGLYAMYSSDFGTAIKESQTLIKMNPAFEKAYLCLGLSQLASGQPADAINTYQQLSGLSPQGSSEAVLALVDAAIYEGRNTEAIRLLTKGIEQDIAEKRFSSAYKQIVLAQLELKLGNKAKALSLAEAASKNNEEEAILFPAAGIYTATGSQEKALAIAAKLSNRFGSDPQAYAKLIDGELKMKAGEFRQAAQIFQETQKIADTWLGRFLLGRAYLEAGAYPEAEGEFDVCLKRRGEATAVFLDDEPSYRYFPEVYYYLGRAREGLHSQGAAEAYTLFLGIKAHSEADPLIRDARARLQKP